MASAWASLGQKTSGYLPGADGRGMPILLSGVWTKRTLMQVAGVTQSITFALNALWTRGKCFRPYRPDGNVAPVRQPLRKILWVAASAYLFVSLLAFPDKAFNLNHDWSSHASFEYFAAKDFQFGKQIFQNVGPFGFVHYAATYAGYLPVEKIVLSNLSRLVLVLLVLFAARKLPGDGARGGWWLTFCLIAPLAGAQAEDLEQPLSYLATYLAAMFLLQERRDRVFYFLCTGLLLYLAFLALTKHTSFVLALAVVFGVATAKSIGRSAGRAEGIFCFAAFVAFGAMIWTISGQHLGNLPQFVQGIFAFSSGYNEAMMLGQPGWIALLSLVLLILFFARAASRILRERSAARWVRFAIECLFLYLIWKHGFVRSDSVHVFSFLLGLLLLAVPWFLAEIERPAVNEPFAADSLENRTRRYGMAAALALLCGILFLSDPNAIVQHTGEKLVHNFWHNLSWLISPREQTAGLKKQLLDARAQAALPKTRELVKDARIDLFGMLPGFILLNDMNYWPRPMPISFAACNEFLEKANETFYRDPRTAPAYVLCLLQTIDRRIVPQDDALALRALLDNYHPVLVEKDLLLLQQNQPPLQPAAVRHPVIETNIQFGTQITLQDTETNLVWLEVEIEHSLPGKLISFCYKPPLCRLAVKFANEKAAQVGRFVTTMGRAGMMINPFVENDFALANLYVREADLHKHKRVEKFMFTCPGEEKYFVNEIKLRLYTVPRPVSEITEIK